MFWAGGHSSRASDKIHSTYLCELVGQRVGCWRLLNSMVCSALCAEPKRKAWRSGASPAAVLLATALSFSASIASSLLWWHGPGETGVNISPGVLHAFFTLLTCTLTPLQLLSCLRSSAACLKAHRVMADVAVFSAFAGTALSLIAVAMGVYAGWYQPLSAEGSLLGGVEAGLRAGEMSWSNSPVENSAGPWSALTPFKLGFQNKYGDDNLNPGKALLTVLYIGAWGACAWLGRCTNGAISTTASYSIQQHISLAYKMGVAAVALALVHFFATYCL